MYTRSELKPIAKHIMSLVPDKLILVGSMRRRVRDGIKDIDFMTTHNLGRISKKLTPGAPELSSDAKILRFKYGDRRIPIEVYYVPKESLVFGLIHYIGNADFNIMLRAQAKRKGYKLNQYGLYHAGTNNLVAATFKREQDLFRFLDFEWKSHEERTVALGKK